MSKINLPSRPGKRDLRGERTTAVTISNNSEHTDLHELVHTSNHTAGLSDKSHCASALNREGAMHLVWARKESTCLRVK